MFTLIFVYALIGLLASFSALVVSKVYRFEPEMGVLYSAAMFVVWPLLMPISTLVLVIVNMGSVAAKIATRITDRSNDY